MITVQDAFKKFKSRLELNEREQSDASRRQKDIRKVMKKSFVIDTDFLTGSYKRWTKTKPLKDVDIFCVLGEEENHYKEKPPSVLLKDVKEALDEEYGEENVCIQRRSARVDFGIKEEENGETGDKVMSFDVVPAFSVDDHYEIPDTKTNSGWTKTNPKIHADKAIAAHDAYSKEWKGLVRMMKSWNREAGKPIVPSFLIEVMALEVLYPPYGGAYCREIQAFFHTLADRINEDWGDPAGLGPNVSDSMTAEMIIFARRTLLDAEKQAASAIRLNREGKTGEALRAWKSLFGKMFPLS